jgi:ABC-2 type transport system permease protein
MNMYLHELKSMRKTAIIWTLVLIGLAAIFLCIYPSMASDAEEFKKLLGSYPPTVRAMLGINLEYITTILGFYSFIFVFIILCGTIQAMNLGVSILSKESRERTADFLLVKPVSRGTIVNAKLLAAITTIFVTDAVFYAVTLAIASSVKTDDFSIKLFFMINLTMLFLQLIFLAIGLVVSVFFKKLKSVLPVSLGIVLGFYMIGALIATGENNDAARYISPFKYFDIPYIINNAGYEVSYLITGAVITVAAIAASYIIYIKKDIHAVS